MKSAIDAAISRSRTILVAFVVLVGAGITSYQMLPKEMEPDVAFPYIFVEMFLEGVSPEDAERLLVRPMEQELRTLEGVNEMVASAAENRATITVEFGPEIDIDDALQDVREKVDLGKAELPSDAEEPRVMEVKFSRFQPMLVMNLGGSVPERTLQKVAEFIKDDLESLAGVLEVNIVGTREELLEVIVNPLAMESYGLSPADVLNFVERNNRLVAAGSMQGEQGQFAIKVPGVIQSPEDVLSLPIKVDGERVVHFSDIATVRRTFKDSTSFARLNGEPAVAIEVVERSGSNIINTVAEIRERMDIISGAWPPGISLTYSRDKSVYVQNQIDELVNNVLAAILLVFIVLIGVLGFQNAFLVGIAVPGSFSVAIFFLNLAGFSINMVVLFAMLMAVGMLVDGAIVVTELADRKMAEGISRKSAYTEAAKRMAWPIIASTATTLVAFLPLVFWPGLIGEWLKFMPLTLIFTLSASLLMALVFVPTMGSLVGRPGHFNETIRRNLLAAETGNLDSIGGYTGRYIGIMESVLNHPWRVLAGMTVTLVMLFIAYGIFGQGVQMYPNVDEDQASVDIRARGDLSPLEKDQLVRQVENRIYGIEGVTSIYVRSGAGNRGSAPDQIGSIRLNFADWRVRRTGSEILDEVRERTADIAGLVIEPRTQREGPNQGKPIDIEVASANRDALFDAADRIRAELETIPGVINAEDTRPMPGIEWQLEVDRAQAARFGADVTLVGSVIQLVTNGIKVGEYRPDDADDEIDIRVRFPYDQRSLDALEDLRIPTASGNVPMGTFVNREPANATRTIMRTDMRRTLLVQADLEEGVLLRPVLNELEVRIKELDLDPSIQMRFRAGAQEEEETIEFLTQAFALALAMMALILITQFNSLFQALLILTAVLFSTGGVLLGLMVLQVPFGLINSGIGAIALAGIVVNNNIVLIDTYNHIRRTGMDAREAIMRTCAQRLRPVLLTTVTTVLGLLPMALSLNIDLVKRDVYFGGPSAQWWEQMATSIAGGLIFATVLTLGLTPALLMIQANFSRRWHERRLAREGEQAAA